MKLSRVLSLLVCALGLAALAPAQNAALMPIPRQQFFDANGYPLAGGLVYTCVAGSSCPGTPLSTYTDSTAIVQNSNPIVLDGGGFAPIWLGSTAYKIVVENSFGVVISTTDNVTALGFTPAVPAGSTVNAATYNFAQTPGGSLSANVAATVPLAICPVGVAAGDYLYVSGGTGTAETVLVTGGTCVGGASGTLAFTPVNSHSGAWSLASATAGIAEAVQVLTGGGAVTIPAAVNTIRASVTITHQNITLTGVGWASVIQVAANANIRDAIVVPNTATGFTLDSVSVDGNRANAGIQGSLGGIDADVAIAASNVKIRNSEIKGSDQNGIFIGDSSISPVDTFISGNYIHDNGGMSAGGYGQGIQSGGAAPPDKLTITGNHFVGNHNTVSALSNSGAVALQSTTHVVFTHNVVVDNFNAGGGQVFLTMYTPNNYGACAVASDWVIADNTISRTVSSYLSDATGGIEICGSNVQVTGNEMRNLNQWGIAIEAASSLVSIGPNSLYDPYSSAVGIGFFQDQYGGTTYAPNHVAISGGYYATNGIGILLASGTGCSTLGTCLANNISITGATISAPTLISNPVLFAPAANIQIVGNPGYNYGTGQHAVTVGASPYTYTAGQSPETVYMLGGTVSSVVNPGGGLQWCSTSPCQVYLPPNQSIAVTYSAAPSMNVLIH